MEIRFKATHAPHYLSGIVFSFDGENVVIEIVDENNTQKALYTIERGMFCNSMRALGISTRQVEPS